MLPMAQDWWGSLRYAVVALCAFTMAAEAKAVGAPHDIIHRKNIITTHMQLFRFSIVALGRTLNWATHVREMRIRTVAAQKRSFAGEKGERGGERGGGGSEREEEAVVVVAYRTRYINSSDQLMASFFRRLPRANDRGGGRWR